MSVTEMIEEVEGTPVDLENEDENVLDAHGDTKEDRERARRSGWRPKEEYNGDQARWVPAKVFNSRAETELPIIRERFRKLDDRQRRTEAELTEAKNRLKESTEVLVELRELSRTAAQRAYQQATFDLQKREREAVRASDEAAFETIARERQILEESRPRPAPVVEKKDETVIQPQLQVNPIITQWVSENSWYERDPILNAIARAYDSEVEREFPGWPLEDKLDEVKRRVVSKFPEKFENTRRVAPPTVSTPSSVTVLKSKSKTYKDLPPDAKAACDKFMRTIPGYKQEDYVKMYFNDEQQ